MMNIALAILQNAHRIVSSLLVRSAIRHIIAPLKILLALVKKQYALTAMHAPERVDIVHLKNLVILNPPIVLDSLPSS